MIYGRKCPDCSCSMLECSDGGCNVYHCENCGKTIPMEGLSEELNTMLGLIIIVLFVAGIIFLA